MANRSARRGRPPRAALLKTRDGGYAARIDATTRYWLSILIIQDAVTLGIDDVTAVQQLLARLVEAERIRHELRVHDQ